MVSYREQQKHKPLMDYDKKEEKEYEDTIPQFDKTGRDNKRSDK